jgi:hypothetical protein
MSEAVLGEVIASLESDEPRRHRFAGMTLLSRGPLFCSDALLAEIQHASDWTLTRAELLAFLRAIVRHAGEGQFSGGISLLGLTTFYANVADGQVSPAAEGTVRDLAILQLVMLLDRFGVKKIRECSVADCQRLFVKTYRREFCSVTCQKRAYKRLERQRQREREELRLVRLRRRREAAVKGVS